ncbi:SNF2 family N-terminal domain-containing protein [Trichophaea hybrida]|nr:SNF2 family N-terminal domain-containing protein [Trichophaea hybrida]
MMRQELLVDSPHSLPVLWEEVENRGETRFRHRITSGYSPERPDTIRGGIIADEMGMGKTLTTLAFIATSMDEEGNSNVKCERSVAQVRATLIIIPAATIVSWKEQITRHTEDLTVLYYSGQSDSDKNAANFDIVIATYAMVMRASKTNKRAGCDKDFFQRVQWRRIVLDEAHVIRNRKAKQTQAICSLEAESRWCLTGTPVQNRLDDFGALLQFLRFAPLHQKPVFSKYVILPLKKGTPDGLKNLKMIIAVTTLRRTKKSLEDLSDDLPPQIDTVQRLNMSEEEQRLHTLISDEAKRALDQAIKNGQEGHFSGFIMQSLLRIRQLCNGIALLPEDFRLDLFGNAARSDSTNLSSSYASTGVCESCQSKLDTATGKLFEGYEASRPASELCPTCSDRTINDADLDIDSQPSTPDTSMLNISKNSSFEHSSSKIQGLIKNLRLQPGAKSVVFACWVSMLNLISLELDRQGIGYTRLDGSMTLERRVQSIKSFREDGNKTVMLATIGSSGVGYDLLTVTYYSQNSRY